LFFSGGRGGFSSQAMRTLSKIPALRICFPYLARAGDQQPGHFLLKRTKLSENKALEFRAEFFNAFNHAQFLNPDRNGFDGTFGQVSLTRGPRLVQFALKFYY